MERNIPLCRADLGASRGRKINYGANHNWVVYWNMTRSSNAPDIEAMMTLAPIIVLAVAGRFELLADCYVPSCGEPGRYGSKLQPECHGHYWGKRRARVAEDLYYDHKYTEIRKREGDDAAALWIDVRMAARGWPDRSTMDELLGMALW